MAPKGRKEDICHSYSYTNKFKYSLPLSLFPHIHEMQQYFDFKRTEEDIAILFLLNIDVYIVVLSEMDLLVHCNLYMR